MGKPDALLHAQMVEAYASILSGIADLGYPVYDDDNFKETPERCARALLNDFVWAKERIDKEVERHLSKTFPAAYDEMVLETNIPVVSLCPHHLLPIEMKVTIAYIPNEMVLGLSKMARLAKILGKQPILQEDYTSQIANAMQKYLNPKGIAVYVDGVHGCMKFRGVSVPEVATITNKIVGAFRDNPATREEFMNICRSHK